MITVWPSRSLSRWARMRATMSVVPAGVKGTIRRTVRSARRGLGDAGVASRPAVAASVARRVSMAWCFSRFSAYRRARFSPPSRRSGGSPPPISRSRRYIGGESERCRASGRRAAPPARAPVARRRWRSPPRSASAPAAARHLQAEPGGGGIARPGCRSRRRSARRQRERSGLVTASARSCPPRSRVMTEGRLFTPRSIRPPMSWLAVSAPPRKGRAGYRPRHPPSASRRQCRLLPLPSWNRPAPGFSRAVASMSARSSRGCRRAPRSRSAGRRTARPAAGPPAGSSASRAGSG